MRLSKISGIAWCGLVALVAIPVAAQSVAAAPRSRGGSGVPWRQKAVRFSDGKAILGLPSDSVATMPRCAVDGTAFLNPLMEDSVAGGASPPELYSVSVGGDVKHLRRSVPVGDFTKIRMADFYVADHTLVTLFETLRDDGGGDAAPRDVRYVLSLSDYDGDGASLVTLDVRFKPLKIALFGGGDFLVLGWDQANLLPTLVLVKPDGTVRQYVDLDRRSSMPYSFHASMKEAESSPQARADLATLQRAAFVPYGREVMLTFPGTAKPIRVLSALGEDRSIPVEFPSGFLLHDVFTADPQHPLVMRAQESAKPGGEEKKKLQQRLFEVQAYNGSLLSEFLFAKPGVRDVACAPATKLTSIFLDTVANVAQADGGTTEKPADDATQMVIATTPR